LGMYSRQCQCRARNNDETMKARLVYLAGPIFGKTDDECRGWRQDVRSQLHAKNIQSVNPINHDYRGQELKYCDRIVHQDKGWIMSVDTVLAYCDEPSFGTAMEVLFAWEQRKQIVAVSTHGSPWLHYHATVVCKSLKEAVELLHA
jgi:nucleoside 2-deoxyribosyltransferase